MHIIYNKFNTMSIVDKIDRENQFGLYIININNIIFLDQASRK